MNLMTERKSNVKGHLERLRAIRGEIRDRRKFFSDFDNKEFLHWTPISRDGIKFDNELVPGSGMLTEVIDWCNDTCEGNYVAYRGKLFFESPSDAAMFLMVWK